MENKRQHILVCPLDWGLGHASRCIPIIEELLQAGCNISIGGSGRSLALLKNEFPDLNSLEIKGFSPKYTNRFPLIFQLMFQLPAFILSIFQEKRRINELVLSHHFTHIISDNRYGLRHKKVKSILMTHQVMIKMPVWLKFLEYPVYLISRSLINRFDECWIPDYEESPGISGDLSHKYTIPQIARFIGPISRFNSTIKLPVNSNNQIAVILSGPEPQRSIFEKLIFKQMSLTDKQVIIVGGRPESNKQKQVIGNITIYPHLNTSHLEQLITTSELVICRSGYSSLMDLIKLKSKAIIVPTPGQTEQIYLARLHNKSVNFISRNQSELFLPEDIKHTNQSLEYPNREENDYLLKRAIEELVNK